MLWLFCSVVLVLLVFHRTFRRVMAVFAMFGVVALMIAGTLGLVPGWPLPVWLPQTTAVTTLPPSQTSLSTTRSTAEQELEQWVKNLPPKRTAKDVAHDAMLQAVEEHFAALSPRRKPQPQP